MMPTLVMTKGLPGSGKSYWAKTQQGFAVVEKDEIRKELERGGWKWSQENEKDVIALQTGIILGYLRTGQSVIAADTNFGKHEARLRAIAEQCKAEFRVYDLTGVPLEVCIARDAARGEGKVGKKVIRDMFEKHIEPNIAPVPVEHIPGLPECVICDLDGTLAIHQGRSPYDTAKCESDALCGNIAAVVAALRKDGRIIIFVSGREDTFRPETERWLGRHGFGEHTLHMRPGGDHRNDAIVKNEIFDREIRGKYNVVCVLDDRDRVVKRWRALGLTCLQVAEGDF